MEDDTFSHKYFFDLLLRHDAFCKELGVSMLLSSKLESILAEWLGDAQIKISKNKQTLGHLIKLAYENNMISGNLKNVLSLLKIQRNYLAHSIYDLLNFKIDETILERDSLNYADTLLYTERAANLNENLRAIIKVIENEKNKCC